MDLKLIQRLVRLMKRAEVTDLEIDDANAGMRVRLKRGAVEPGQAPVVQVMQGAAGAPVAAGAVPMVPVAAAAEPEAVASPAGHQLTSPLVGTFYTSPSPEAGNFVDVGSHVELDQVMCIVEAMKVMNEIKSDVSGEVLEILVENGEPVEYGQPLFLIKTR